MLKTSHKIRLIITKLLLAMALLTILGEAAGYSITNYFGIPSFQIFLVVCSAAIYLVIPPREVIEEHTIITLPVTMPLKWRRIILTPISFIFLIFLSEKYTSLNFTNFSDTINFETAMILCGIVAFIVYPPIEELRQSARKLRRPKSLNLKGVTGTEKMSIIAVPVTTEALDRLDFDECLQGDLIEQFLSEKECVELFNTGVFIDINSELEIIVDYYEDAEITGPEKLSIANDIIDGYLNKHPNTQSLRILHRQIVYANKYQTAIFFYF